MPRPTLPREDRFGQTPILRMQVSALRTTSEQAVASLEQNPEADHVGLALTSNLLSGFCLELGLKLFYLTFKDDLIPHREGWGHNLKQLFENMPPKIRGDIEATFQLNCSIQTVSVFGLVSSAQAPKPPELPRSYRLGSAGGLFEKAASMFEDARYFYEGFRASSWSTFPHLAPAMNQMSHVLDTVYDEYRRVGGWAG